MRLYKLTMKSFFTVFGSFLCYCVKTGRHSRGKKIRKVFGFHRDDRKEEGMQGKRSG